jgi:hypothetical protein
MAPAVAPVLPGPVGSVATTAGATGRTTAVPVAAAMTVVATARTTAAPVAAATTVVATARTTAAPAVAVMTVGLAATTTVRVGTTGPVAAPGDRTRRSAVVVPA